MKKKNEAVEITTKLVADFLENNFEDYQSKALDFLSDNDPDVVPMEMSELDTFYEDKGALEAITRAFYGCRYNPYDKGDRNDSEPFNPNNEYFAYNAYGNLVSIDEYDYAEYVKQHVDLNEFADWLIENDELDEDAFNEWADENASYMM